MEGREAEQTLAVIRTLMERGTRYTHLSSHAGLAAGGITLIGCGLRVWLHTPFLPTWLGVLIAAAAASVYFTAAMAHANGEPFWTRQTRTVVMALLPALGAGLVLTSVLSELRVEWILPGVWMLLWGCGALAMSFFTPRVISMLGIAFLAAGSLTLGLDLRSDALTMGLTFGAIHLAYGLVLTFARQWALSNRHLALDA
ncbi:MAG: hypothetical protein ACK47B_01045 [Armatimonadota bacterium]